MSNLLATARASKLAAQTRCPVCGAERGLTGEFGTTFASVAYLCSAEFVTAGEIIVSNPCPNASTVAARQLNQEAAQEAAKAGAA